MQNHRFLKFVFTASGVLALLFLVGLSVNAAWAPPTVAPPGGNVAAPVNVGTSSHTKTGGILSVFDFWVNNAMGVTGGATFGGNVGIGTAGPGQKLQVEGNIQGHRIKFPGVGGDSGIGTDYYAIYQESGPWVSPYPDLRIQYHTGIKYDAYNGYGGHQFYTGYDGTGNPAGLQMQITDKIYMAGNVGIGTTSPGTALDVFKSSVGSDVNIRAGNTDNTNGLSNGVLVTHTGGASGGDPKVIFTVLGDQSWSAGIDNSDGDKFKIASTADMGTLDRFTIQTGGNVGIGTTAPVAKLHLSNAGAHGLEFFVGSNFNNNAGGYIQSYDRSASAYRELGYNALIHTFGISGTEKMRIHSDGNVGIGTTGPSQRLDLGSGSIRIGGAALGSSGNCILSAYSASSCPAGWFTIGSTGGRALCGQCS